MSSWHAFSALWGTPTLSSPLMIVYNVPLLACKRKDGT